ncbi:MAG TPA: membrane protein insertase YidC [Rhodospirillaceae bacterium]|nr:membrane protein insertase YidC [Rhodospirillaceae bacterium]
MNFDPPQPGQGGQGGMHPKDKRNLIIFVLASLVIWLAFEHFVIGPRTAAIKQQQIIAEQNAPQSKVTTEPVAKIIPRAEKIASTKRLPISSNELMGTIPLVGNRIDDIVLKNYFTELKGTEHVVLMSPNDTDRPHYAETGWLSDSADVKMPDKDSVWTVEGNAKLTPSTPVTLTWSNGAGVTFDKTYAIDDHFMLTITQKVTNSTGKEINLYPYSSLTRKGLPENHGKGIGYEGPMGYISDELQEIKYGNLDEDGAKKFTSLTGWIGFGEKYWLSALLPPQMEQSTFTFQSTPNLKDPTQNIYQVDIRGGKETIASGQSAEETMNLFVGAKQIKLLDEYEEKLGVKHFDLAVDFGLLYFLTKPLYFLLILFNSWVGNFGIAIILLTFVVRGAVYPLASKSYRSFAGLRKVAPKMAEIKERYGNDKARLHQELVKLYETEKVNPMAGCFPILLQMPIFFAIYKVMSIAVEMRHAPFFGWIHDLSAHDPLTVFNLFGLLPFTPPTFLMIGPWSILMLVLMLIQKHLNPPPQDQIQKDMANFMPWVMTYVLSSFASGLVIYWAVSNLLSVLQQAYIMRSMGVPIYLFDREGAKEHAESHKIEAAKVVERIREEKADKDDKASS